jgi:hypothetical protein
MILLTHPLTRPVAWLFAAFSVSVLCFWYPLLSTLTLPRETDPRLGMLLAGTAPLTLTASLLGVICFGRYLFLIRNQTGHRSILLLTACVLMALVSVLPGCWFVGAQPGVSLR